MHQRGRVLAPPCNPPRGGRKVRIALRMMAQPQLGMDAPSAAVRPTLCLTRGKPRSDRIGGGRPSW